MDRPRAQLPWSWLAIALLAAGIWAGCGSGERTFDSDEVIEQLNAHGAGLALGEPLSAGDEAEIRTITFTDVDASAAGGEPAGDHAHGGGTLLVVPDAEEAQLEFERCQGTVSLTCFRAANVVLRFEELPPTERVRLESALQAIETIED